MTKTPEDWRVGPTQISTDFLSIESIGSNVVTCMLEEVFSRSNSGLPPRLNPMYFLGFTHLGIGLKRAESDSTSFPIPKKTAEEIGRGLGKFSAAFLAEQVTSEQLKQYKIDITNIDEFEEKYLFPLGLLMEKDKNNNPLCLLESYAGAKAWLPEASTADQEAAKRNEYGRLSSRYSEYLKKLAKSTKRT